MKEFQLTFQIPGQYRVNWEKKEEFCVNLPQVEEEGALPKFSTRLPNKLEVVETPAIRKLNLSEKAVKAWREELPSQTIQYELGLTKVHYKARKKTLQKRYTPEQIERMHLADFLFDTEGIYFSVEEILDPSIPMTLEVESKEREEEYNEYLGDLAVELLEMDL